MSNPTGAWALENEPAFEEFFEAVVQVQLEFGAAGDDVVETKQLRGAVTDSMGVALVRLSLAITAFRDGPPPPDRVAAGHLARALDHLEAFCRPADALSWDAWVATFTKGFDEMTEFSAAFAAANGQTS